MTRDEILARWRHLRGIGQGHAQAATRFMTAAAMVEQLKRLGLARGRKLAPLGEREAELAGDLAVHTSRDGRSSALGRYARAMAPPPGSDERLVLDAMLRARFSVWKVERRHELAGLVVSDVMRDAGAWLVDEALETEMPEAGAADGAVFAGRLFVPEGFAMTSGLLLRLTPDVLEEARLAAPALAHGPPDQVAQDPRFAAEIYRAAIASGVLGGITYKVADR